MQRLVPAMAPMYGQPALRNGIALTTDSNGRELHYIMKKEDEATEDDDKGQKDGDSDREPI